MSSALPGTGVGGGYRERRDNRDVPAVTSVEQMRFPPSVGPMKCVPPPPNDGTKPKDFAIHGEVLDQSVRYYDTIVALDLMRTAQQPKTALRLRGYDRREPQDFVS